MNLYKYQNRLITYNNKLLGGTIGEGGGGGPSYVYDTSGYIPYMTTDVLPEPFVASADSTYYGSPTAQPWGAFSSTMEYSASGCWVSTNDDVQHWCAIDVSASILVYKYVIGDAFDENVRSPKDWEFQGSTDNSNWTTLDTQSNQSWSAPEEKSYTLSPEPTTAYRYFRYLPGASQTAAAGSGGRLLERMQIYYKHLP